MARGGLDHEALIVAAEAVKKFGYGSDDIEFSADELAEVAVNAYINDIIRQLDLSPCKDCEKEDQDGRQEQNDRQEQNG